MCGRGNSRFWYSFVSLTWHKRILSKDKGVENNALSSTQAVEFDKELADCRKSGGDCQKIIDKWKAVSDKQSAETDQKLKDNPLEAVVVDKDSAQGGVDMTERPDWLGKIPGVDVMTSDEAKAYVQQWNGQDLANIDVNSPSWTKFAAFVSDPENQAAVASLGMLSKDLIQVAKNFVKGNTIPKGLPIPDGLSKEIHPGQQGKHVPGHNNYTPGCSPLIDGVDPQKLLNGVHSGEYKIIRMTPRNQPVVNFGKPIGTYEGQPTSYGIIHYGKNGAHIVPANPVQH